MSPRADAIARLIIHEGDAIKAALERAGVPEADIPDLCQDVALVTLAAVQRGDFTWSEPSGLRAYLRTVAWRRATAFLSLAARRELPFAHPEDDRTTPPAEDRLIALQTLRVLAASTTPLRWKTMRAYASGFSVAELADRYGVPPATIYNRLRLARRDFARALARESVAAHPQKL